MAHDGRVAPLPGELNFDDSGTAQYARGMAFVPGPVKAAMFIAQFAFEGTLRWFTRPVEVVARRRFGVRALTPFAVAQMVGLAGTLTVVSLGLVVALPLAAFFLLAAGLAVHHCREARRHERAGADWRYTYWPGDPVPAWDWLRERVASRWPVFADRMTPWWVTRFGEPLVCLVSGAMLLPVLPPLGSYLLAAAAGLALKGSILFARAREMDRDRRDAAVVGVWLTARHRSEAQPMVSVRFTARVLAPRVALPAAEASRPIARPTPTE